MWAKSSNRQTNENSSIPDKNHAMNSFTHELNGLAKTAGLHLVLNAKKKSDPLFDANWSIVLDWKIESRYLPIEQSNAESIFKAAVQRRHGVLPWIRKHW